MERTGFIDQPPCALAEARVAILPIPWEGSVSWGGGAAAGPAAIIEAARSLEEWDADLGWAPLPALGVHIADSVRPHVGEAVATYMDRVRAATQALEDTELTIGLGGDHSVTPPQVAARLNEPGTVVQIDAHADLRETYDGTPHSHACPMRRVLEHPPNHRLIQIGVRSIAEEEAALYDDPRIDLYAMHELRQGPNGWRRLHRTLRGLTGPVFFTVDIDGLDPSIAPATGTPLPGGLSWWEVLRIIQTITIESGAVLRGADVVETAPVTGSTITEVTAASLVFKILSCWGWKSHGPGANPKA